jgi:Cu/Ag efflux protein CusF
MGANNKLCVRVLIFTLLERQTMARVRRSILLACVAFLVTITALAQKPAEKKSYTFHGKVESVDKAAKSLNVQNERIEGWMEAMTMLYPVDDVSILDKLKAGDLITATVYDGDYSLHNIKIVSQSQGDSKK